MYQAISDFSIRTPKGDVAIKAGQIVALPEDTIKALLKKGKIKGACIKWDTLSSIHLQIARQLATEGRNLRLHTPEIVGIENTLNEAWLDCLHGRATINDFREINRLWAETVRATSEKAKRATLF